MSCPLVKGCVNVITDPKQFPIKVWEGLDDNEIQDETKIWLALGCHPENSDNYDETAERHLAQSLDHPRVVALGEIGLDDVWDRRGVTFESQAGMSSCFDF